MKYKILNTSINQMDGSLKITIKLPERYSLYDIMDSIDETVKKYGNYRGTALSISKKYENAYVFDTNVPYQVYMETIK